eukprot:SAG31_NODE_36898_length_309_cov_0.890476_1_plen_30_part_01
MTRKIQSCTHCNIWYRQYQQYMLAPRHTPG